MGLCVCVCCYSDEALAWSWSIIFTIKLWMVIYIIDDELRWMQQFFYNFNILWLSGQL